MAKKFELTVAPNYVSDWTVVDAIRELFQNAKDQETIDPSNAMFFDYYPDDETLKIGNLKSELEIKSLLFGGSTKADDENTIGQFGEGYKLASLVLVRGEYDITFYNYGKRETWKPRFVNSRRYGSKILTFFVDKHIWNRAPNNNLEIVVEGITIEDYKAIRKTNLHINKPLSITSTAYGDIIWDDYFKGDIFVNGLLVEHRDDLDKGYSFKPKFLKLGRDRRAPKDWDLRYLIGRMIAESSKENDKIAELVTSGSKDAEYAYFHASGSGALASKLREDFTKTNGTKAVPVTSQYEIDELKSKYEDVNPIIVKQAEYEIIKNTNMENLHEIKVEVEEWDDEGKSLSECFSHYIGKLQKKYDLEPYEVREWNELMGKLDVLELEIEELRGEEENVRFEED